MTGRPRRHTGVMEDGDTSVAAGDFDRWLADITTGRSRDRGADVPCGTCTACCTSSQFVHVESDEADTLRAIPAEVLFPAPGLPPGNLLMGYDEDGCCPMFVDGGCSIYEHRPRTCRRYDCRVFTAAGITPSDPDRSSIAERVRRWAFDLSTEEDRARFTAVQASGAHLAEHPECLPAGVTPSPADLALLAIHIHELFLDPAVPPGPDDVAIALRDLGRPHGAP